MFHLTIRQLRIFDAVARHLNFSRAAEALFLSQPAVSMQIKQLEDNVGLPLFEKQGKRLFLTEAGNEFLHYCRTILQQIGEVELVITELKGLERGHLNISVVSTANYFMPQLLAKFCKRYPGINVILNVANRDAVLQQLADNVTDLAVMGQPPQSVDIVAESFMKNPLVVIAPPDHRLCKVKRVKLKQLEQDSFLLREPGSGTRGAMERFFAEHGVQFRAGMEMGTNEAIKQAVQAGMGLGILSLHSAELELETGRLVVLNVEHFPIVRHWYIAHRKSKRLSGTAQAFKQFLLTEAESLAAPTIVKHGRAK
ncbi:MAG: LysR family transcriptional regulator [Sideroxydans sp.]|nr:LysR family transcriptional regulator [Sideroxydans sp.]